MQNENDKMVPYADPQPISGYGKFLLRTLHLLNMVKKELEWEQLDEKLSDGRRKRLAMYDRNHISFVLRDLLTSTPNSDSYNKIYNDLTNERAHDLALWLDFGLGLENIGEVLEGVRNAMNDVNAGYIAGKWIRASEQQPKEWNDPTLLIRNRYTLKVIYPGHCHEVWDEPGTGKVLELKKVELYDLIPLHVIEWQLPEPKNNNCKTQTNQP